MAGSIKRPIALCKISGEKICEYPSVGEAAKDLGIKPSYIFNVLSGRCKQTKGMVFKYLDMSLPSYAELKKRNEMLEEENKKLVDIVHTLSKKISELGRLQ